MVSAAEPLSTDACCFQEPHCAHFRQSRVLWPVRPCIVCTLTFWGGPRHSHHAWPNANRTLLLLASRFSLLDPRPAIAPVIPIKMSAQLEAERKEYESQVCRAANQNPRNAGVVANAHGAARAGC